MSAKDKLRNLRERDITEFITLRDVLAQIDGESQRDAAELLLEIIRRASPTTMPSAIQWYRSTNHGWSAGDANGMLHCVAGVRYLEETMKGSSDEADARRWGFYKKAIQALLNQYRIRMGQPSEAETPKQTPSSVVPAYLNPEHPRYAPKLAAAVRAWEAVTDPAGKHPKQAATKWLEEHAAEYGLTSTSIPEIAAIVNWRLTGGAPPTPTKKSTP